LNRFFTFWFFSNRVFSGVRVNAPMYTTIATLTAVDMDADSVPVYYQIKNVTYFRPRTNTREILDNDVFIIDPSSGILQTNRTLGQYADGYFNLVFKASNGPNDKKRGDFTSIKVKHFCSLFSTFLAINQFSLLTFRITRTLFQDTLKDDFSLLLVRFPSVK
jgi:hypothetical protein